MLSEVFWVAFITTTSGVIIKLAAMAYKSKCREIECCCIKIVRDIDAEARAEAIEAQQQANNRNSLNTSPRFTNTESPRTAML
jgi:hypothetical protein